MSIIKKCKINKIMIRIKSLFFKLLYGISLLLPYTNDGYKTLNSLFGLSTWMNCNLILYLIFKIVNVKIDSLITLSLIILIIIFSTILMLFLQINDYLDKTRAEKFYRMEFTRKQKDIKGFSSSAIDLHERYGKNIAIVNHIKYIEDKAIIEKHKKYNRKLMAIGVIYSFFSIIGAYVFFKAI